MQDALMAISVGATVGIAAYVLVLASDVEGDVSIPVETVAEHWDYLVAVDHAVIEIQEGEG